MARCSRRRTSPTSSTRSTTSGIPTVPSGQGGRRPTPFFKTSVGQHIGKKEISRTQVGAEFFTLPPRSPRDLRPLARSDWRRTGSSRSTPAPTTPTRTTRRRPVWMPTSPGIRTSRTGRRTRRPSSSTTCTRPTGKATSTSSPTWVRWGSCSQRTSTSSPIINVPGVSDTGYHGTGHVLNADLLPPVDNNHSPRFFAWHRFNDAVWVKREPRFTTFQLAAVGQLGISRTARADDRARPGDEQRCGGTCASASAGIYLVDRAGHAAHQAQRAPRPVRAHAGAGAQVRGAAGSRRHDAGDHAEPAVVDHSRAAFRPATSACRTPTSPSSLSLTAAPARSTAMATVPSSPTILFSRPRRSASRTAASASPAT